MDADNNDIFLTQSVFKESASCAEEDKESDDFKFRLGDPLSEREITLQVTVKRLCKTSGIEGMKINHSLRATAATRLYQGHRSDAVRNYKRTSDNQKATVSDILSMLKKMNSPSREEADAKRADDQ
ncbi:uncharacterized protein LOC124140861 [Haliotis rufescens]|uniref:uncharacterized protein LOC124140861 n=1 Tax=Haliotis rufescens TaxID=6454 RepID=UPI00201F1F09|nr:uncharacterized protein LOC124140861 [Haliotis rufescens]